MIAGFFLSPGCSSNSGITRGTVLAAKEHTSSNSTQHLPAADNKASAAQRGYENMTAVRQPVRAVDAAARNSNAQPAARTVPFAKEMTQQTFASETSLQSNGATAAAAAGTAGPTTSSCARLCVGIGRASMSRTEMFRASHGVAVEMMQRVYDVPSPSIDGE